MYIYMYIYTDIFFLYEYFFLQKMRGGGGGGLLSIDVYYICV